MVPEFIDAIRADLDRKNVKLLTPQDREQGKRVYSEEGLDSYPALESVLRIVPGVVEGMREQADLYPESTVVAIFPRINMVFALWTGEDTKQHLVGFKPLLVCDRFAVQKFIDSANYSYEQVVGNVYYLAHTRSLERLRREAKRVTAKVDRKYRRILRRGEDLSKTSIFSTVYGYDKKTTFPADYLALAAREFIDGEKVVDLDYLLEDSQEGK